MKICLIYVLLFVITISGIDAADCPNCAGLADDLVCATNGVDFRLFLNDCGRVRQNCLTGSNYTITSKRYCNQINDNSTLCDRIRCTTEVMPVCGKCKNNLKIFQNYCQMLLYNCAHKTNYKETNINQCNQSCNQYCADVYNPICGKNGDSYLIFSNECFLTTYNCENNKNFLSTNLAICPTACVQACVGLPTVATCGAIGTTFINFRNQCLRLCAGAAAASTASCCNPSANCGNNGPAVCATDGLTFRTFRNICLLNVFNCVNGLDLQVTVGTCPAANSNCATNCANLPQNQVCGFDGTNYILFRNLCALTCATGISQVGLNNCGLNCPLTNCPATGPAVCATDGSIFVPFPNLCEMNNFNCQIDNDVFNSTGLATCPSPTCVRNCANVPNVPVCGFDGTNFITFNNVCLMNCATGFTRVAATACPFTCALTDCTVATGPAFCATDGAIFRQFANLCEMNNFNCATGSVFVRTSLTVCPAPICIAACANVPNAPVCGSDGTNIVTFNNTCLLLCTGVFVQVPGISCGLNCPTRNCTNSNSPPICAVDGVTVRPFENVCFMDQFNCLNNRAFTVTALSRCNCQVQDCTQVPNNTVCGRNSTGSLQIFSSVCLMKNTNCLLQEDFTQIDLINCIRNCTIQDCTGNNGTQVCGSNGDENVIFRNKCRMDNHNCRSHTDFTEVPMSVCDPNNCTVPTNCSTEGPVCGFNGTIYELFLNECRMLRRNCIAGDDFLLSNMNNCVPSSNCTINPDCPRGNGTICATNGEQFIEFRNTCTMENFNCRNNETFVRTRRNLCDPSDPCVFTCPEPQDNQHICGRFGRRVKEFANVCEMDEHNCRRNTNYREVDIAECNNQTCTQTHCSPNRDPICATNGIHNEIFDNICTLNNYNCRNNANFTITSMDNCGCQRACPFLYAPVCGKCGHEKAQIFSNQCLFNVHSCENNDCRVVDMGFCENDPSTCKMISCANVHNPICAYNGKNYKTFNNLCLMDNYNCLNNDKYEKCDPKKCNICTEYKCSNVNNPVCAKSGDDVREFENRCKLDNYNCRNNADYQIVDSSNCKNCKILKCANVYNPVCATNGKLFKQFTNRCLLDNYNCKNDEDYNECDPSKCESNQCKILKCSNVNNPICATNGKIFKEFTNRCLLDNYNCKSKEDFVECEPNNCKKCTIHECLNVNNPICATDGKEFKLFSNRCFLDNFNCEYGNDFVECDLEECKDNNNLRLFPECKVYQCTNVDNPVCATDGNKFKMFKNRCFLNNYNCENDVDYDECDLGNCKKCTIHNCTNVHNPICGTNGKQFKMFSNRCYLENYNCEHDEYAYLPANKALCTTAPDVCLSSGTCIGTYYPVCIKTSTGERAFYTNPCNVAIDNCLNKGDAKIVPYENCDDVEVLLPIGKKCVPCPNYFPYNDICAENEVSYAIFSSKCNLKYYNCRFDDNFKITDMKKCKALSLNYEDPEPDVDVETDLAPVV